MQTKFMLNGSSVAVLKFNEDLILDQLPPRIYNVNFNMDAGFYLDVVKDKLELPGKVYGIAEARANKCIASYKDRTTSTGILLTGDKGTGKTLFMSLLANKCIDELGLPIILVKDAYAGTQFVSFIESIGECVLVFDEFGKMYAASDRHIGENEVPQSALLSLMDGTDKTKRMLILSENHEFDINEFMMNRPSRVYYHFRYRKLDEASIVGYCNDYKTNAQFTKDLIDLSRRSRIFSFDMLQSIVEEHLRFGCDIETATKELNIDTREVQGDMIEIIKVMERHTEVPREIIDTPFVQKPSNSYSYFKVKNLKAENETAAQGVKTALNRLRSDAPIASSEADDNYEEVYVRDSDLAYEKEGKLVYETEKFVFIAKNVEQARSNYMSLF